MNNIFSVDVEEWYHVNYASADDIPIPQSTDGQVVKNVNDLLTALAEYKAHATFFFLGSVAERYPQLVRLAQEQGHEIASHGYGHQLVYQQTPAEFHEDVNRSIHILQDITGQEIQGYRAPSWSINKSTRWAYEILLDLGIKYDASLFPFSTFLYGDSTAPVESFAHVINGQKLYEVPATVMQISSIRIPFGGGFYFRFFPYWMTRLAAHFVNRQDRPVIYYLHPREIDPSQPRLPLPARDYFITYVNLAGTLRKVRRILSVSPTISILKHLEDKGFLKKDAPTSVQGIQKSVTSNS